MILDFPPGWRQESGARDGRSSRKWTESRGFYLWQINGLRGPSEASQLLLEWKEDNLPCSTWGWAQWQAWGDQVEVLMGWWQLGRRWHQCHMSIVFAIVGSHLIRLICDKNGEGGHGLVSNWANLYIKVLILVKQKERALVEGFSTNVRPSWGHNYLVLFNFSL